ncbi:MAG: FtsH protease activity modulator HflK [Chloroflexi bacterium]|nr:FtsH protease activity modulator HflK [Chloroflexota bacterium]
MEEDLTPSRGRPVPESGDDELPWDESFQRKEEREPSSSHHPPKGHSPAKGEEKPDPTSLAWQMGMMAAGIRSSISRVLATGEGTIAADLRGAFGHILTNQHLETIVLGVLAAAYVLSGVYVVNPGEEAVVRRFGQVIDRRVGEGLRYRLPWPIEQADKVNVSQIRREGIGVTIPDHPTDIHPPEDVQILTGDENIINAKVVVQYRVKDPADYLFKIAYSADPLIRNAVKDALVTLGGRTNVDDLLTTGRPELQQALEGYTQKMLDQYESGLQVVNISLQEVNPPKEVADAFRDVASAREDRAKAINDAQGYQNSIVPEARGKAQRAIREAEGYKADVTNRAKGEAKRFEDTFTEYERSLQASAEDVTRYRLYVEAMEKILPKVKKYVVDPGENGEKVNLRILEQR